MKILFLHGWNSAPGGEKPTDLAARGHEVVNPELPREDFGRPSGSPRPSSTGTGLKSPSGRAGAGPSP